MYTHFCSKNINVLENTIATLSFNDMLTKTSLVLNNWAQKSKDIQLTLPKLFRKICLSKQCRLRSSADPGAFQSRTTQFAFQSHHWVIQWTCSKFRISTITRVSAGIFEGVRFDKNTILTLCIWTERP